MNKAPTFQSDFLEDLATAFRKRRKALKHKSSSAECTKVYELINGEKKERLEISVVNTGSPSEILRLHAWPDRWLWLYAELSAKKRVAWNWGYEGRLLGDLSGARVVRALEETHERFFEMAPGRTAELTQPWQPILARGPSGVR